MSVANPLPNSSVQIVVDIAFGSGPQETEPAWAQLGSVISVDIQRGRTSSTEAVQAGRATILVDNRERLYDPANPDSYEYGNGFRIEPGKQIRINAQFTYNIGTANPVLTLDRYLFFGHVIGWYIEYSNDDRIPVVRIEAVDAFGYFGTRRLTISLPQQTVYERLSAILDAIEWPRGPSGGYLDGQSTAWRFIDLDNTLIAATTYTDTNALDAIQNVALAARGTAYMEGLSNRFLYLAESNRLSRTSISTEGYFGAPVYASVPGFFDVAPYQHASFVFDRTEIYNEARITPSSGVTQIAVGETVNNYFRNIYNLSVPLASDDTALQLAQKIVNRYQYPRRRLERLTIGGDVITANRVRFDINEYISVEIAQHTGPSSPRRFFVEGVHHRISSLNEWKMTFVLSPAEYYISWLIGSTDNSRLGETTILG